MTCRHSDGDPDCSSSTGDQIRVYLLKSGVLKKAGLEEAALDIERSKNQVRFGADVLAMQRVGQNVVMRVKCPRLGIVVLVFGHASELAMLKWREVRTTFAKDGEAADSAIPVAIFPNTQGGWANAIALAGSMPGATTTL